jgi:capsular exopolysaccharide synthesis family protein
MEKKQSYYFIEEGLLFDPIVTVRDVLRKWFLVVVLTAFFSVAAFIAADLFYTPQYESSATLVATTYTSYTSVYDNIDSASSLAAVFSEILNSSVMKKNVMEQLNLTEFPGTISAACVDQTNLLMLKVRSSDPRTAFMVIQALIENHEAVTYDVIGDISVEVLQYPTVPTAPVNPSDVWGVMGRALLLSAIAVCALLAVQSVFRDTVRSRAEAERKLDCWCLGEIHHERRAKSLQDIFRRRKSGILVTKPETSFGYVTTMSKLCRRVRQHMRGGNVLAVTSVAENEGKTTVAANLALSMAQKWGKVLLIDCDLRKPACHRIMEATLPKYCINDVLEGKAELEQAVVTDRLSGLQVLYARKVPGASSGDLLNTGVLQTLIPQVRKEYNFVIIDLPPMSAATDSEYIAEYADASLLVVRQNGVGAPEINRAVSVLENVRARLLGCVLNNVHSSFFTSGEGYSGHYGSRGYGNGRYGKDGKYGKYGHYGAYGSSKNVQ